MRTAAVVLVAATLAVSACGTQESGATSTVDGRTFTMAISSDPGNLDPHLTVLSVAIQLDRFLYDTLLTLGSDGQPAAGLAEKWSATTTEASFTLRGGITCQDGSPLTAGDVAANINFVSDPANKSPYVGLAIAAGTKATADDAARTVKLTGGAPDAFLLRNVGELPMLCGKGVRDRSLAAKGEAGTGMFTMTEAVPNDHYTLTRRKDYTRGSTDQHGLPDKVVVRVMPNPTTAANLLLSGELNAAAMTGPDRQRLDARKLFHADFVAPIGELFFNEGNGHPGRDEAVRRALVQSLDLAQLGKVLTNGTGKQSQGMVTAEPRACSGDTVAGNLPTHDVTAAKSALDGKRLALTVIYATQGGPTMAAAAELLQQQWKSIGIDVTLKGVDSPGLSQVLFGTGEWDVSMGPITVALPSQLVPFLSGPTPPNGTNFGHIGNTEFDTLTRQASAMSGAASCQTWTAAETALIKHVDVVPHTDSVVPFYGSGAKFEVNLGIITPSSIRMYSR